jgi:hypothetical protein
MHVLCMCADALDVLTLCMCADAPAEELRCALLLRAFAAAGPFSATGSYAAHAWRVLA